MADDRKSLKLRQSKGNNTFIADDYLINLRVHNQNIFKYVQYKFHEIPSLGYLAMDEDGTNHRNLGNQRAITPHKLMAPW